jgi:hypothetical protein
MNHDLQHDLDVLLDRHARDLFALRRAERMSEAQERLLDRRLRELAHHHDRAARRLEAEYRRTHYDKPPVAWPARDRPER